MTVDALIADVIDREGGYVDMPEDHALGAAVIGLLYGCGPATVARFVVPIHVDAIERHAGLWAWPYVEHECGEVVSPFVAHRNATAAIERELAVGRIEASPLGVQPRTIFLRSQSVLGMPMRTAQGSDAFGSDASTGARAAISEIVRQDGHGGAAVALTSPRPAQSPSTRRCDGLYDCESAELLPS